MTIELIDQFILSSVDSIVAQELFKVDEWSFLYSGHALNRPKLFLPIYIFIIRSFDKKSGEWSAIGIPFYQTRGWAQKAFYRNREHILKFRSVSG